MHYDLSDKFPSVFLAPNVDRVGSGIGDPDVVRTYNSGMIKIDGKMFLATRATRLRTPPACRIYICSLSPGYLSRPICCLALEPKTHQHEDARLFMFGGRMHVAYTAADYSEPGKFVSRQMLAILATKGSPKKPEYWAVEHTIEVQYGGNRVGGVHPAREKNWMPWAVGSFRPIEVWVAPCAGKDFLPHSGATEGT